MPGFSFYFNTKVNVTNEAGLVCADIQRDHFQLHRFTIDKFLSDKLFEENDRYIIVLEGVIFNRQHLLNQYRNTSWSEVIWQLYTRIGDHFMSELRGSFSGLLYDKHRNRWIIFTDHLGTKMLYYYYREKVLVISSEIGRVYDYLRVKTHPIKLNINGAYMLLSYGYMLENNTLCEDIHKVMPGNLIVLTDNTIAFKQYYKLPKSSFNTSYDETDIIEQLDKEFRNAVKLQFSKDKEYGYRHFVSLSGGLDSRMVSWVANDIGFTDQINFTFSQTNYLDETTPKKIAEDLKHEWIFKSLDNGLFLQEIDSINSLTGGNVQYFGLAHTSSMYRLINFSSLGIVHSGQLGDAVIGSIVKKFDPKLLTELGGAYSAKFTHAVQTRDVKFEDFADLELSLLYQRGLNGANNGNLSEQRYTETMSPFYDINFFEYCLSIPINARIGHNIYKKWILKKYPAAARYVWESTKQRIDKNDFYIRIGDKSIPITQIHHSVLRKLGLKKKPGQTRENMNPIDYWYSTNPELKQFFHTYFDENMHLLDNYPEIRDVCTNLFNTDSAQEKVQVLTLLSALKLFSLK